MREQWVDLKKYNLPRKVRKAIKPMINMLYLIYRDNIGMILALLIDSMQDLTKEREKIKLRKIEIKYNDYFVSVLNCETNEYEILNNKEINNEN